MRIPDPFQMNDWNTRRFMIAVTAIHLAMWCSMVWEELGLPIPVVRPLIGLLYTAFVPGIVMLRALRVHELGSVKTVLISVVTSLATTITIGLLLNSSRYLLGIDVSISAVHLTLAMSAWVAVLCIHILRDGDDLFSCPTIETNDIFSPPYLAMIAVVILTISGMVMLNNQGENSVILFTLTIISVIFVLVGCGLFFSPSHYPALVFTIAISLLLHTSLVSEYIWGADIQLEYYLSSSVLSSGVWDPSFPSAVNSMLSVVILAPALSSICNLSLVWVFKLIYPALFALVPLGLFEVYREQTDSRIAVLASLFFISLFTFFREMTQLARQEIAELVLVAMIVVMLELRLNGIQKMCLLIVFGFLLVVSHNGLTFLFVAILVSSWFLLRYLKQPQVQRITRGYSARYIVFLTLIAVTWYTYVSQSAPFNGIVGVILDIVGSSYDDVLNPSASQGLALIVSPSLTIINYIGKFVHLLPQVLISIGVLISIRATHAGRLRTEFLALSVSSFIVMIAGLTVPFFASSLNASRLYQIGLIFLAPFSLIGMLQLAATLGRMLKVTNMVRLQTGAIRLASVFFMVFLLFNTGFMYELADQPKSFSLNSNVDTARFNTQEVTSAEWLLETKGNQTIYADAFRWLVIGGLDWKETYTLTRDVFELQPNSYIFLGTVNVMDGRVLVTNRTGVLVNYEYVDITEILSTRSRLFDNGGSRIYL